MAHATERDKSGRQPVNIVEMDLDFCDLVYGVGACTAAGGAGDECYNTRSTTQDATNYTASAKTYSFCEMRAGIPAAEGLIPSVKSVSIAPTKITVGEGLGARARATVVFQDHPHHDRGIDPYVANRAYDPMDQGTFWGKILARNKYYQGRVMRIKSGYIGDTFDLGNDFVTRTYLIQRITGPDASGRVTITAQDPLKLADDDRAQAPVANSGVLAADIAFDAGTATLSPAGVGNDEYAASGTVTIGSECMTFTRAGDVLTLTARGTDGTGPGLAHSADDSVQECIRWTNADIDDILYTLLVTYAGVPAGYITAADWQQEVDDWLSSHTATALITEPTGVKELIDEICQQYMVDLWWDERVAKILMKVLAPYTPPLTQLTDEANIVAESGRVTDDPDKRISQVWIYFGVIDPTESLEEPRNYNTLYIRADLDAETADQYDESRIRKYFSRWFTGTGDALRLGARMLMRNRDNPRTFQFTLDAKDSGSWTGDTVGLVTGMVQDVEGADTEIAVKIIETKEKAGGHSYDMRAVADVWTGRYGRIAPDAQNDYDAATDEEKFRYAFVSEDAAPKLNGDGAYLIV